MNKSFHYFCIRVLAEKAGFAPDEAQVIAYASQYTDDSTEFGKMTITGIPEDFEYARLDRSTNGFDPVCTAHAAKSWYIKFWKWAKFYLKTDVQRKILMPFHFLPPEPLSPENRDRFDFITRPNSVLAKFVVDGALAGLSSLSGVPGSARDPALIKLGIALHTYADTWSHDGFSGRHNSLENDIKEVKIRQGSRYQSANLFDYMVSYAAPDVGHAEANVLPDEPDVDWKAKYAHKKGSLQRDNTKTFLTAAGEIYHRLSSVAEGASMDWVVLSDRIRRCLVQEGGWQNEFPEIEFVYHRFTWRASALTGDKVGWDDFDDESDFQRLHFRYTGMDMKWFHFHKAAYEQRVAMDGKIPKVWLSA